MPVTKTTNATATCTPMECAVLELTGESSPNGADNYIACGCDKLAQASGSVLVSAMFGLFAKKPPYVRAIDAVLKHKGLAPFYLYDLLPTVRDIISEAPEGKGLNAVKEFVKAGGIEFVLAKASRWGEVNIDIAETPIFNSTYPSFLEEWKVHQMLAPRVEKAKKHEAEIRIDFNKTGDEQKFLRNLADLAEKYKGLEEYKKAAELYSEAAHLVSGRMLKSAGDKQIRNRAVSLFLLDAAEAYEAAGENKLKLEQYRRATYFFPDSYPERTVAREGMERTLDMAFTERLHKMERTLANDPADMAFAERLHNMWRAGRKSTGGEGAELWAMGGDLAREPRWRPVETFVPAEIARLITALQNGPNRKYLMNIQFRLADGGSITLQPGESMQGFIDRANAVDPNAKVVLQDFFGEIVQVRYEVDIANLPFERLPPTDQREKGGAAGGVINMLRVSMGRAKERGLGRAVVDLEEASAEVHEQWLERNRAGLGVLDPRNAPYAKLHEDEKNKDRAIVRAAVEYLNEQLEGKPDIRFELADHNDGRQAGVLTGGKAKKALKIDKRLLSDAMEGKEEALKRLLREARKVDPSVDGYQLARLLYDGKTNDLKRFGLDGLEETSRIKLAGRCANFAWRAAGNGPRRGKNGPHGK